MALPEFGAGAYPYVDTVGPIGGNVGYRRYYSPSGTPYTVETWPEFKSACSAATSGQLIWVPDGVTISIPAAEEYNGYSHPVLKPGVILASNRGQNGAAGGRLYNPNTASGSGNYMSPIFYASSNCIISGLVLEGPGCFGADTVSRTNAAIRCVEGSHRVEVENCEIKNFFQGGVYMRAGRPSQWNSDSSTGRHWIHHCKIHGMQRHGFGYGCQVEFGASVLVECCDMFDCRHFIAGGYEDNCYEIRYCTIGDSWYKSYYEDPVNGVNLGNTQLDAHGSGPNVANGGDYMWMHHNTLSNNRTVYTPGQPSIGIRGKPEHECRIYNNWSQMTYLSKGPHTETVSHDDHLACLSQSGGGAIEGLLFASYNMHVYDNWYGTEPPPGTPTMRQFAVSVDLRERSS
jgi:hypothetical protein